MSKIKYVGLILLIVFTFAYTDKVLSVINDNDSIMQEIRNIEEQYKIVPIDATIKDDSIIPGINGREIDILASYNNMKRSKVFNPTLLEYRTVFPENSIRNNMNKYIIHGNSNKNDVAIIYILSSGSSNILYNLDNGKIINIFINCSFLENNMKELSKFKNNEIYNYGDKGLYTNENIIIGNNIINNKTNNKSIYCLSIGKNSDTLDTCMNNKMWTIIPSIVGGYIDIKNSVKPGSIILLENIKELNVVVNYLINKGYNIVSLSKLLSENID